jgi:hypothetical protein
MILYDPLPYCRLGIERLAVLVVDHLGGSPADLWPVLRTASLLGAVVSGHVLIGEAGQAQIKTAVTARRILPHFLVAMTAMRAVAIRVDVAHRADLGLENAAGRTNLQPCNVVTCNVQPATFPWSHLRLSLEKVVLGL